MSVVLGKLAEPHPDGKVQRSSGFLTPEAASEHSQYWMEHSGDPGWRDDPLYFAAERVKKNRRQKLLSIR